MSGHPVFGATTAGGASISAEEDYLEYLLGLLGNHDGDLAFLLPFAEGTLGANADVQDLSNRGLHASNITAVDLAPVIRGDLLSVRFNGTDEYMEIADNALLSAISGGVDTAFSVGCAFMVKTDNANLKQLITKWDDQTPNAEWRFILDGSEKLIGQLFDNDVANSERGRRYDTSLGFNIWYVGILTYSGVGGTNAEDGINMYLWEGNGHSWMGAVDDTDQNGVGVYVDMEDTAQPVMIGAGDTAGGPAAAGFWPGEMMLPFMTRRELSAGDARRVAETMVHILGL